MKLTWDDDDPERTRLTRRNLSNKEIDEIDFKDLIGSASSEDEESPSKGDVQNLRKLLLSGNEDNLPEGWGGMKHGKAGEMEITFTPGLSGAVNMGTNNGPEDETTLEKYQRKERERKKAKRAARNERLVAKANAPAAPLKKTKAIGDAFFGDDSTSGEEHNDIPSKLRPDNVKVSKLKNLGTAKDKRSENATSAEAATSAELSLILDPLSKGNKRHFDMADIIRSERRAEKGSNRHHLKRKRMDASGEREESGDAVEIDLDDPRFQKIYSDPSFAIDPANPQYVTYC